MLAVSSLAPAKTPSIRSKTTNLVYIETFLPKRVQSNETPRCTEFF